MQGATTQIINPSTKEEKTFTYDYRFNEKKTFQLLILTFFFSKTVIGHIINR